MDCRVNGDLDVGKALLDPARLLDERAASKSRCRVVTAFHLMSVSPYTSTTPPLAVPAAAARYSKLTPSFAIFRLI
jgi:hypothetical protein